MLLLYIYISIISLTLARANVEKTVFVAPSALTVSDIDPTLDDLGLDRLTPSYGMLRTRLNASFPITDSEDGTGTGTQSWYFLENLTPGQRYEVRICWLASQPTEFTLITYTLPQVLEETSLLSALSLYSSARLSASPQHSASTLTRRASSAPTANSVLFLRIDAAADYFSLNKDLMETVPPVLVDIILDPFLGNVFPKSLVPTAGYIVVVACLAVFVAGWIAREFARAVDSIDSHSSEGVKKNL
ncbi:hypothetical protein BJX99DRAFT_219105 [Aspergillus californicus]